MISTTTIINPMSANISAINSNILTTVGGQRTYKKGGGALQMNTKLKKTYKQGRTPASPLKSNSRAIALPPTTSTETNSILPAHGRRLRQRPQRYMPNDRNSTSSTSTSFNISAVSNPRSNGIGLMASLPPPSTNGLGGVDVRRKSSDVCRTEERSDLTESLTKYFGVMNRIESGEQFTICAKRRLPNGQVQYLIEWGETTYPPFYNQNINCTD